MNIASYIKGLAHRFGKNQIQKSCELVNENLRTHTIPAYQAGAEMFRSKKIRSKEGVDFVSTFKRLSGTKQGTMLEGILDSLQKATIVLERISAKSETLYSDQESNLGLTFQKATYMRLVTCITFTNDFSRKFLNYIYVLETAAADEDSSVGGSITPIELKMLHEQFINFCTCIRILQDKPEVIETKVDTLPDAIVSDSAEKTMDATLGKAKMDPLGFSNFTVPIQVPVTWNPFYWAGVVIADIQTASYKAAKEECDLLQLRKLNLERILEKKPDAQLQAQIEHLANRIDKLNYETSKLEARYA